MFNAKLCEWKQVITPSMPHIPPHTPELHGSSLFTNSEEPRDETHSYIVSFNTGYSPADTFLYKYRWTYCTSAYILTPATSLLWMWLRWSGLNSSQMLTMRWWWAGIQGWLHPHPSTPHPSCNDSLWQVQNTCLRCTLSQASATS